MNQIIIELRGGLIEVITGIPKGSIVKVRDYDIEGCDNSEVTKDEENHEYFKTDTYFDSKGIH